MALSSTTLLEVEIDGSDTANSGGFNPANANMATDLAGSAANTASPVVTSASYDFTSDDVGYKLFIQGGTDWTPGWYTIVSVADNAATLSAAIGSAWLYNADQNGGGITNSTPGCASVASPSLGTWSIDYSINGNARISYTDMVIDAVDSTKYTSAANPVGWNIVGNLIQVTSGSGFTAGWYEVVSTSGTTATCDRSLGSTGSTGGNAGLGGALGSPGQAAVPMVAGNIMWWQFSSSPYLMTNADPGQSGPILALVANAFVIGYDKVRGDETGNRPQLLAKVAPSDYVMATANGDTISALFKNIELNGNNLASTNGMGQFLAFNCVALNFTDGTYGFNNGAAFSCLASNCYYGYLSNVPTYLCVASNCTFGYYDNSNIWKRSIAKNCVTGFNCTSGQTVDNCIADSCSSVGVYINSPDSVPSSYCQCFNVIASNCGTGYSVGDPSTYGVFLLNCASYNNDADFSGTPLFNGGFIALTEQPYVVAGSDYRPNLSAGGGMSLLGTALGVFGQARTTDRGAVQAGPMSL